MKKIGVVQDLNGHYICQECQKNSNSIFGETIFDINLPGISIPIKRIKKSKMKIFLSFLREFLK